MKILQAASLIVHMLALTWLQSQLSEFIAFFFFFSLMIIRCNAAFHTTTRDITKSDNTHGENFKETLYYSSTHISTEMLLCLDMCNSFYLAEQQPH